MFHLRAMPVALVLVLTGLSISSGLAGEWPVATSADGKYVVCSVDNGGVYVVRDADTLAEIRRGGSQMKMAVPFFSGDGKRLFVLNLGNPPTIRVERPSDGREIASFGLPADASYKFLVADERGSRLAVAVTKREGSGRNITLDSSGMVLIDVDKGGREVARIAPTTAAGDVVEPRRGTTFIESGRQLLVAHWKSGLDLYDANSGELVRTVSSDGVCYPSPDGSRYLQVSGARDNEVAELIETDGGRKLMTLPVAPPGYMDAVWSPDGKMVHIPSGQTGRVFDVSGDAPSERVAFPLHREQHKWNVHFHAGKDLLFFATDDDMAVIDIGDKKMRRVGSRRSEDIPEVDAAPPANPLPDEPRDKPDDPRPEPPAGEDRDAIKPYDPASGEESVTLEAPRRKAVVLDRRLGYTMEVPSWPKPTGGGQTVMLAQFFDSKGAGTLQPNVNINAEQRRVRQDQLADDMRATYSRLGSNVTLGDARNISCDGKDGVQMDVASTINNTRMVCRVACIIDAPLVYTVTCVCTDEDKADYLDRFDVCIGSIRFSGSVDVPRGCVGYANADYGISLHSPKWAGEVAIGRQETPTFSTRGIQIMAKVSDLTIVAQMSPLAAKDHLKMWKDVSAKVKNDEALDVSCGLHTAEGQYWENNDSTGFYLAVNRARRIMLMVKAHSTPQESRRLARPMAKALRTFTLLE